MRACKYRDPCPLEQNFEAALAVCDDHPELSGKFVKWVASCSVCDQCAERQFFVHAKALLLTEEVRSQWSRKPNR